MANPPGAYVGQSYCQCHYPPKRGVCGICKLPVRMEVRNLPEDLVNHPPHYTRGGIEVWDIIDAYELGAYESNVVEYVLRAKFKNGGTDELKDLRKARQNLDRLIKHKEPPHDPRP